MSKMLKMERKLMEETLLVLLNKLSGNNGFQQRGETLRLYCCLRKETVRV